VRNELASYEETHMGYTEEGTGKYSFLSFVLSVAGFFLISFYQIGLYVGVAAIIVSFLAGDLFKERSMWQYVSIIIAVIDIFGSLARWNLVLRGTS
jgi:hypothetical protein